MSAVRSAAFAATGPISRSTMPPSEVPVVPHPPSVLLLNCIRPTFTWSSIASWAIVLVATCFTMSMRLCVIVLALSSQLM